MDSHRWGHATWTELARLGVGRTRERACGLGGSVDAGGSIAGAARSGTGVAALLPAGAIEAHGPHLPLATDMVIAEAAAAAALDGLQELGLHPFVLPPLAYTAAPFAAGFPGTVSLRPATVAAVVTDIAESLAGQGVAVFVIVNAHVDPTHLQSLHRGVDAYGGSMPVVFPDISAKPWVLRMSAEFKSGACHAGRYETSVVMAAAPSLVRDHARRGLAANPASLSSAIRDGAATFEEAGAGDAYCGDPASATREEGLDTIQVLGRIVVDAVATRLAKLPRNGDPPAAPEVR